MEPVPDSLSPADRVPEAPPTAAHDIRRSMWRWVGGMVGFVVAAAVVGGMLFRVPYVALVPGSARDTEPLLVVDGLATYPSEGELLLTTVRTRQRPNLWEYLWLQADSDNELVPEDLILGGRTPDQNRDFNLQLMNDSKSIAVAVALEQLGYDAIRSDGVIVVELVEGGSAEGLLELGDAVVAIDGEPIDHTGDLVDILSMRSPGDEIVLTVEPYADLVAAATAAAEQQGDRNAVGEGAAEEPPARRQVEVPVVLGGRDDDPDAAFLGVGPTDRVDINDDFDFTVAIDSGSVGGPSAGLAFALAVLDELTEGELTGGAKVAVTGTIDVSGRVGTVGGVLQKTAAVRDLGADAFLVPAGLPEDELDRIRDKAGDHLRIVPVATLDEALVALSELGGETGAVEEFAASNLS
ncbi:MAG: PDZ domain-containing protein [Acidimicrobiales bacterium]